MVTYHLRWGRILLVFAILVIVAVYVVSQIANYLLSVGVSGAYGAAVSVLLAGIAFTMFARCLVGIAMLRVERKGVEGDARSIGEEE